MMRYLLGPVPAVVLSLVLMVALFLLTSTAHNAEVSAEFYSALLVVNSLGIIALTVLIGFSLWRLYRRWQARRIGSRMTLRLVGMFALLVLVPLSVVYYFSIQFLNKGVDSWFDVRVEQAIDDALLLGRTTLEAIKEEAVEQVLDGASRLADAQTSIATIEILDEIREQAGYTEVSLYTHVGRIIASSSQEARSLVPDTPDELMLSVIRKGDVHASLEPISASQQQLRVVVPVFSRDVGEQARALQVLKPLPLRYAKLADRVESASAQFKQMMFSRGPFKFSLMLTLTLVTLVATLLAIWAAIYVSQRLVAPLQELAEGTRAVAEGNYRKKLPVTSSDELGVLVESFNDMTRRINKAQNAVQRSQRETEDQRAYLETVLGHLSSGVLSFDRRCRLLTQNATARQILGSEFAAAKGRSIDEIKKGSPRMEPFFSSIEAAMRAGLNEWQTGVAVFGARGRQTLMSRGTRVPGKGIWRGGYVVVFDDVTDLIQAQRDAAWGEVARRLAHEIKNPLTPIQLSAERIRRKYLDKVDRADRSTLDRATRTIAQQVESLKEMVNSFSKYAQPAQMRIESTDLNHLVQDVAELHKRDDRPILITLDLASRLPPISADRDRLRQVLNNLIINARDALSDTDGPEIHIATRNNQDLETGYIELYVEDNGPGVPEDMLDRLFEPYVTTKEKGTGLGLAIVKRIVEEHGGTLWAENRAPKGARVTIRLPRVAERGTPSAEPKLRLVKAGNRDERIA